MKEVKQKALITGASGGIGKELAMVMAEAGHDLVLVARSEDKLSEVKKEIISKYAVKVSVYACDLSEAGSAASLYETTKKEDIKILVNNAGVGLQGNFFDDDQLQTAKMVQLNVQSLMELTQLFGRDFLKDNSGRILNVSSIAAFFPGPKQPVYFATKSFVRSFSRALSYNVRGTGVTVTLLHPGVTKTDFFKSANAHNFKGGAPARAVARTGYKAMMSGKIEVTHGFWNKILTNMVARLIPYRLQALAVDRASDV